MKENRLIFFGTIENQEAVGTSKTEKSDDMKKEADMLAQLEKMKRDTEKTEKGEDERDAALRTVKFLDGKTSDAAKKLLEQQTAVVKNAKPERLEAEVATLKKITDHEIIEQPQRIVRNAEYTHLANLPNKKEAFSNLNLVLSSKTGGDISVKNGEIINTKFENLSREQQKTLLKAMKETLGNKSPESAKAVNAILAKFAHDSKVPKKHREYAKNPEKWNDDREHAAQWLLANADKIKLHTAQFDKFKNDNRVLFEQAKLVPISTEEFSEKSTGERNDYLEGLKQKIAHVDSDIATKMSSLKISEGTEIKSTHSEMKSSATEAEKSEQEELGLLATRIQNSPLRTRLLTKIEDAEKTAEKDAGNFQNPRETFAYDKKASLFKKIFARFNKNATEKNEVMDEEARSRVATGVIEEMIGDTETNNEDKISKEDRSELDKIFGSTNTLTKNEIKSGLNLVALDAKNLNTEQLKTEKNKSGNEWMKKSLRQ